jgi:hypothetical protein
MEFERHNITLLIHRRDRPDLGEEEAAPCRTRA